MEATVWKGGSSSHPQYGIRVGYPNRRAYFKQDWTSIEVEMDGRSYYFNLTPGFWNQCPEFRDRGTPVIREWLRKHRILNWASGNPPKFELTPLGNGRFRLVP